MVEFESTIEVDSGSSLWRWRWRSPGRRTLQGGGSGNWSHMEGQNHKLKIKMLRYLESWVADMVAMFLYFIVFCSRM